MKKTVLSVTLYRLLGLIIFLILLGLANIININNRIYIQIVDFLNQNLGIIIIFSIFFYLGELFFIFKFPLNIPGPLLNAFGGIYLVKFIFKIFFMVGEVLNQDIFNKIGFLEPWIISLVFVIVIIAGYAIIIMDIKPVCKEVKKGREEKREREGKGMRKEEEVEWKDIGKEFKKGLYNLGVIFKKSLEPKKKKEKWKERKKK